MAKNKRKKTRRTKRIRPATPELLAKLGEHEFRFDASGTVDNWTDLEAAAGEGGACPRFDMVAYTGGIMTPKLPIKYGKGVVLDLRGWRFVAGQLPINWQHDNTDPVGHCEQTNIANQVTASGLLSVPGESTDKIVEGARNGFRWRPSVEGVPVLTAGNVQRIGPGQTINVNGQRHTGPFLLLREGEFKAIAFVTVAGDSDATSTITAQQGIEMDFEQFLKATGVDRETATAEQLATLQAAFDAMQGTTPDDDTNDTTADPNATIVAALTAALGQSAQPAQQQQQPAVDVSAIVSQITEGVTNAVTRRTEITQLCAASETTPMIEVDGEEVELSAHAIANNWDTNRVELELYRVGAARPPAIHSKSKDDTHNIQAMAAAVMLNAEVPLDSPYFSDAAAIEAHVPTTMRGSVNDEQRQRTMEAAHGYGDVNMLQLAADCCRIDNIPVPRGRENLLEAAASSGSLHQVYNHTVGASALVGYREQAATLPSWSTTDTVDDFKEFQRHREDQTETLGYHPPNGDHEADHLGTGAEYECLSVDMYSGQKEIGIHDMINNNLGLIARQPRKMGQAARRTEEVLGYAVLLSNPTMKSTGRQLFNTTDGTLHPATPLTITNASKLIAMMSEQTDGDAVLDLMASRALVPAQLYDHARKVYRSERISNDSGEGELNPVAEHGVQPLKAVRIGIGARHPKTKTWYLGSQVNHYLLATGIEVAVRVYLAGRQRIPRMRVTQLQQGRWGQNIDVNHIVGFGFLSTKGMFLCQG